jgi:hypothetical protein
MGSPYSTGCATEARSRFGCNACHGKRMRQLERRRWAIKMPVLLPVACAVSCVN